MKYVCDVCGWEYDEDLGLPEQGIAPGTKLEDLPEDFECPLCGVGKDQFSEAYEAKDFRTMQFLDWFVKEQGEEETNANDMITKMELFGSDPKSLYMLNQELAARVYSAPSLVL